MRKILLLLTVLAFTSCTKSFRNDDVFIIDVKETHNTSYKYLYRVKHYCTTTKNGLFYITDYIFISNDNYELGDTIKFSRHTYNEK